MKLLLAYEDYYLKPDTYNLEQLCYCITNFADFKDYPALAQAIFKLRERLKKRLSFTSSYISTTGSSTGTYRDYKVGPNFNAIRIPIERYLRSPLNHRIFYLSPFGLPGSIIAPLGEIKQENDSIDYIINFVFPNLSSLPPHQPASFAATPLTWLLFSTNPEFDTLINGNLVNMDWELFVKDDFHQKHQYINDQMIDWYTGLNFYTCPAGYKHTLPIFCQNGDGCTNLLNMSVEEGMQACDDHFAITGVRDCACGKQSLVFEFRSHAKNYLDLDRGILNKLKCRYTNWQVLEVEGKVKKFFYITKDDFDMIDKPVIEAYLNSDVIFCPDSSFLVGRKSYSFWKVTSEDKVQILKQSKTLRFL